MQEYIIKKKEFEDAEHTIMKITTEWGVSVVRLDNYDGPTYNIALIKFTDLGDQYDLVEGWNFIANEKEDAKQFVEALVNSRVKTELPIEQVGKRLSWK